MIDQERLQEIAACYRKSFRLEEPQATFWLGVVACLGLDEAGEYATAVTEIGRREQNHPN